MTYEAVNLVAAVLRADAGVQGSFAPGGVPVFEGDESVPATPPGTEWVRIVVREPVNPFGAVANAALVNIAPVEVRVELARSTNPRWRPHPLAAAIHARAYTALVGRLLPFKFAAQRDGITIDRPAPSAAFVALDNLYGTTAVYRIPLAPVGTT